MMGKGRSFVTVTSEKNIREKQKYKTAFPWQSLLVPNLQDIWSHKWYQDHDI